MNFQIPVISTEYELSNELSNGIKIEKYFS